MESETWTTVAAAVAGGGLTAALTTLTRYWMARRGMDSQRDESLLDRMEKRITVLEQHVDECHKAMRELERENGTLKAHVALLTKGQT